MGLLFFGGVMSLWWIGGLTLFVLLEKVMPFGAIGGRLIGGIVAVWGLLALIQFLETETTAPKPDAFSLQSLQWGRLTRPAPQGTRDSLFCGLKTMVRMNKR